MKFFRPGPTCAVVFLLWILNSCATPSGERIAPPENIIGLFSGRDGGTGYGVEMEMRFLPGGTVHIRSVWEDDGISYSETGSYIYKPDSGRLDIVFDPEISPVEISTAVTGKPAVFVAEGIEFVHLEKLVLPAQPIRPVEMRDRWIMNYLYEGELVEVILELEISGLFTETTKYSGADNDLVETGRYELDEQTGLISFFYSTRPEYGYSGYYDKLRDALYTYDGDFYRED